MLWRASIFALSASFVGCSFFESFEGYSDGFDADARGGDVASDSVVIGDSIVATDSAIDSSVDAVVVVDARDDDPGVEASVVDACPSGKTPCGARCVDVGSDPDNCGKCGISCAASKGVLAQCNGGACVCRAGTTDCGTCTHLESDPKNCGGCGKSVDDDSHWCRGSASTCRPGTEACVPAWFSDGVSTYWVGCDKSYSCTDRTGDGSHCYWPSDAKEHRCWIDASTTGECYGNDCHSDGCPSDRIMCESTLSRVKSCFDPRHDSNHCGACFHRCASTQTCVDQVCVDYRVAIDCSECGGATPVCCDAPSRWGVGGKVCYATGTSCGAT